MLSAFLTKTLGYNTKTLQKFTLTFHAKIQDFRQKNFITKYLPDNKIYFYKKFSYIKKIFTNSPLHFLYKFKICSKFYFHVLLNRYVS